LCLCRYFYEHGLVFSCTLEPPNIMLRFRPIIIRDIHLYTVSVWCYSRICVRTWSLGQNLTHNRRANVELSILLSLWISLVVFSIDGQSNYTAISEQGRKVKCVRQDRHALGYFMTRNDAAHELQTTTSNRSASTSRLSSKACALFQNCSRSLIRRMTDMSLLRHRVFILLPVYSSFSLYRLALYSHSWKITGVERTSSVGLMTIILRPNQSYRH